MTTASMPRWPRLCAPVAAIWYAFGLSQCILGFLAMSDAAPMVIWIAYASACLLGIVGSAALFFTPTRAAMLFAISLVAALIYYVWLFTLGVPAGEDYAVAGMVIGVTLVLTLAARRLS